MVETSVSANESRLYLKIFFGLELLLVVTLPKMPEYIDRREHVDGEVDADEDVAGEIGADGPDHYGEEEGVVGNQAVGSVDLDRDVAASGNLGAHLVGMNILVQI